VREHLSAAEMPVDSCFYGGQPFDWKSNTRTTSELQPAMTTEWHAFGDAYWMVPVVELKRQRRADNGNNMTRTETTLAVHLVIDTELLKENSDTTTTTATDLWQQAARQTKQEQNIALDFF
jgi:hypothetical protein